MADVLGARFPILSIKSYRIPTPCPNTPSSSANPAIVPPENALKTNRLMANAYSNKSTPYTSSGHSPKTLKFTLQVACGPATNPAPPPFPPPTSPPTYLPICPPIKPPPPCCNLAVSTSAVPQATFPGSSFLKRCSR